MRSVSSTDCTDCLQSLSMPVHWYSGFQSLVFFLIRDRYLEIVYYSHNQIVSCITALATRVIDFADCGFERQNDSCLN